MPENTMQQAAKELHSAVLALKELIERDYPSRREVERRFQPRNVSNKRWSIAFVMIVASGMLSFFTTVGTVSACFLGADEPPQACNLLPGYADSMERNQRELERFSELQRQVERMMRGE